MKVRELYNELDARIPRSLSCSWDNDGLMCCPDGNKKVNKALIALDVTGAVVEYAKNNGYDVIISHHPFIFNGLKSVDDEGYIYIVGRIKDTIVLSSGENIAPEELESKFRELDCVRDCLIYKGLNDNGVEALILEMTPRMDVLKELGIENVGEYCVQKINEVNSTLLNYQKISKIVVRTEDFERTPSMKIKRPKNVL